MNGGIFVNDAQAVDDLRKVAKDILREIGRRIMFGKFDLSTLQLPISAFMPRSVVQHVAMMLSYAPKYYRFAASKKDPLQRFKLAMAASIAGWQLVFEECLLILRGRPKDASTLPIRLGSLLSTVLPVHMRER